MLTRLIARGSEPASVFGLLGLDENSATFSLGWTLSRSPAFVMELLKLLGVKTTDVTDMVVDLQRHANDGGYTDLELRAPDRFHLILEAKRGWALPGEPQLVRYVARLSEAKGEAMLVSITAADAEFARRRHPKQIGGVSVQHRSWLDVRNAVRRAGHLATGWEEKLWLRNLDTHLGEYVAMQNESSNLVYVVSLSGDRLEGADDYTWIDVVETDHAYFHPYQGRGGWPVVPPNYLGFRYDGKLQYVRHIESTAIVTALADIHPAWRSIEGEQVVYRLGPPMRPPKEIRTGKKVARATRVWCAIDTLLSGACSTISDARDETSRRLTAAQR